MADALLDHVDPQVLARRAGLAARLRADAIRCTTAAGSGHPTSSMSAADLMAVLLDGHLRRLPRRAHHPVDDHLVFSKGHASPLLYAMLKAAGVIDDAELMTLRRAGSRLEGHPTPRVPWVDAATGSLGQGLAVGVGLALGARLDRSPATTWVLLGDSEMAEGSNWEAFDKAAYYRLDRLVAIIDVNRLGQRGETELGWNVEAYRQRAEAFGWRAFAIDGHDLAAIDAAYLAAREGDARPTCIVARTVKGAGVSFLADHEGWHGKALDEAQAGTALAELDAPELPPIALAEPEPWRPPAEPRREPFLPPAWKRGDGIATRKAYGEALKRLGDARGDVVALDGEVGNSTYAELFAKAHPDRFFEMFIAEQQLLSAAQGLAVGGRRVVFASTFAAFWSRAHDQARMAAIARADLRLCGSHAGVAIGEDGPSQMALEDLALFRALDGSTVLYPCDATSTAALVAAMAELPGLSYLRTTRQATPVLYEAGGLFPIGGSRLLRASQDDRVTIVGAGVTVHEALAAADELGREGIAARVVDAYSVKPLDGDALADHVAATAGALIVVEDHRPEGGLGEACLSALAARAIAPRAFAHLAVRSLPGSATPHEQLARHGIDRHAIVAAARRLGAAS